MVCGRTLDSLFVRRMWMARPRQGTPHVLAGLFALGVVSSLLIPVARAECIPLPSWSVCASFFPPGTSVQLRSEFSCFDDAEATLNVTMPALWSGLKLAGTNDQYAECQVNFAELQCLMLFPPCGSSLQVSRSYCYSVLGNVSQPDSGYCPHALQQQLIVPFLPDFSNRFNCDGDFFSYNGLQPILPSQPVPVPTCQPLASDSVCRGAIGYDVFVASRFHGDQRRIETHWAPQLLPAFLLADTHTGCRESIQAMLCGLAYPRCETNVLTRSIGSVMPPVPFPRLPCRSLCENVSKECRTLLHMLPSLAPYANCTGEGVVLPFTPVCSAGSSTINQTHMNFPETTAVLAILQVNGKSVELSSTCNNYADAPTINASLVLSCPLPLVPAQSWDASSTIAHGSCALPCPTVLFTESERHGSDAYLTALIILSFISSGLLWLTWLIFPVKRKQTNTLMMNTCTFALSVAMMASVIATGAKPSVQTCKNSSSFHHQRDGGVCLLESMFLLYFTMAGVLFWLASALDLYLKIVMTMRIDSRLQKKLNKSYMITGWGLPGFFLIIALSVDGLGGSEGVSWCFFSETTPRGLEWAVFYYPIAFLVFTGSYCMTRTIWRIIRSTTAGPVRQKGWWRAQVRPVIFVGVFVFIFAFVFAYRVNLYFKEDSFRDASEEFVRCILQRAWFFTPAAGEAASDVAMSQCGDGHGRPTSTPDIGLYYFFQFAVGAQGLLNSAIFGPQKANWDLWTGLLFRGEGVGSAKNKQPLAQQQEGSSERSNEYGSSGAESAPGAMRSHGMGIPYAARNRAGQLMTSDDDSGVDHMMYSGAGGGHHGFSGGSTSSSSPRYGSRPGSYVAPVFERGDDVVSASSYTTLPAAIGSMMNNGHHYTPLQTANSRGGSSPRARSPRDNSPARAGVPRRGSVNRGPQMGPHPTGGSARVPAGVATASVAPKSPNSPGSGPTTPSQ